jgi:hypothetical protein
MGTKQDWDKTPSKKKKNKVYWHKTRLAQKSLKKGILAQNNMGTKLLKKTRYIGTKGLHLPKYFLMGK